MRRPWYSAWGPGLAGLAAVLAAALLAAPPAAAQRPDIIFILADDLGYTVTHAGKGIERYNLAEDDAERNNLAAQHPEMVQTIARLMSDARTDSAEFPIRPSARDGSPGRGRSE